MYTDFIEIRPSLCDANLYGSEPALFDIIVHYYKTSGFNQVEAVASAKEYVLEWSKVYETT